MIRIRKQNNALYRDVCDSIESIVSKNDERIISLYCLLQKLCEKWKLGLSYDVNNNKLKVYSHDGKGYERMMHLYGILQESDIMKTINLVVLPKAKFEDIDTPMDSSPDIISGETAEFFTKNQNITYNDEFHGLKELYAVSRLI